MGKKLALIENEVVGMDLEGCLKVYSKGNFKGYFKGYLKVVCYYLKA